MFRPMLQIMGEPPDIETSSTTEQDSLSKSCSFSHPVFTWHLAFVQSVEAPHDFLIERSHRMILSSKTFQRLVDHPQKEMPFYKSCFVYIYKTISYKDNHTLLCKDNNTPPQKALYIKTTMIKKKSKNIIKDTTAKPEDGWRMNQYTAHRKDIDHLAPLLAQAGHRCAVSMQFQRNEIFRVILQSDRM